MNTETLPGVMAGAVEETQLERSLEVRVAQLRVCGNAGRVAGRQDAKRLLAMAKGERSEFRDACSHWARWK